jgi:hypothetical protein
MVANPMLLHLVLDNILGCSCWNDQEWEVFEDHSEIL